MDTIECLESLSRLSYNNFQTIVVDNLSTDNSLLHIINWAKGNELVQLSDDNPLRHLSTHTAKKPIPFVTYTREEAEKGGTDFDEGALILIQTGENLGFAGGNNVALRYALKKGNANYLWLLNNDTVVEPDSLLHLVKCHVNDSSNQVGIVGGKILYYYKPTVIQCIGGAYYNKWWGYSQQIGNNEIDCGQYDSEVVQPDLIIGACMLISRTFLEEVGLLNEEYFLYFEEQDWAERASRKNYRLSYSSKAIIYHKEGATIGAGQLKGSSKFSDYYFTRSKILFTERYYSKITSFTVKLGFVLTVINRIRRRQYNHIPMLIKTVLWPHNNRLKEGIKK